MQVFHTNKDENDNRYAIRGEKIEKERDRARERKEERVRVRERERVRE